MKKIICMLGLLPLLAFSGLNLSKVNSALRGIKRIGHSSSPTFYNANKTIKIATVPLTTKDKADILLFSNSSPTNKMLIVNSYRKLKSNKNSIAAIYVKKGRTQIIFVHERLRNRGFKVSKKFKNNLINECQLNLVCLLSSRFNH